MCNSLLTYPPFSKRWHICYSEVSGQCVVATLWKPPGDFEPFFQNTPKNTFSPFPPLNPNKSIKKIFAYLSFPSTPLRSPHPTLSPRFAVPTKTPPLRPNFIASLPRPVASLPTPNPIPCPSLRAGFGLGSGGNKFRNTFPTLVTVIN